MKFRSTLIGLMTSTALSGLGGVAIAQETEEQTDEVRSFDTIVVTGRGREENFQDAPVSAVVVNADTIENAAIRRATDLLSLVPNISIADAQDSGNISINIRGVGQIRNGEASVAVSVDGVLLSSPFQISQEFFDIETFEVLRGPQGALFGRNAIAGAINITTKQPTNEFAGNARIGYGNGDSFNASAAIQGPLIEDKAYIRVGVSHRRTNGFIENTFLNEEVDFFEDTTARARIIYDVTDNFNLDLRGYYNTRQGGAAFFARPLLQASGIPFVDPPVEVDVANTVIPPTTNNLGRDDRDLIDFSLKAEWETPIGTISSITSYSDVQLLVTFDGFDFSNNLQCQIFGFGAVSDGLAPCADPALFALGPSGDVDGPDRAFEQPFNTTFQDNDIRNWSQEIRITSPSDQRLRYAAGAYFLGRDRELITATQEDLGFGVIPELDFDPTTINETRVFFAEDNDDFAYALFGSLNFDVTDRLEVSFSGRYDNDEREQTDPRLPPFRVDGFQIPIDPSIPATRSATFDKFQPKATVRWQPTDDITLYFDYAQGFRSGGFNAPGTEINPFTGDPIADSIFEQEESENFEFGAKTSWFNNRLIVNGAIFFGGADDLQTFNFNGAVNAQIITNIDETDIFGFEIEWTARPWENFTFFGGYGFTDSEIEQFDASPVSVGNQVPFTVRSTLNLGFEHILPIANNFDIVTRFDYERRGRTFFQEGSTFVGVPERDPIDFISARVALVEAGGWSLAVWGKNLLDEEFFEEVIVPDFNFQGRPRTYGAELSVKF